MLPRPRSMRAARASTTSTSIPCPTATRARTCLSRCAHSSRRWPTPPMRRGRRSRIPSRARRSWAHAATRGSSSRRSSAARPRCSGRRRPSTRGSSPMRCGRRATRPTGASGSRWKARSSRSSVRWPRRPRPARVPSPTWTSCCAPCSRAEKPRSPRTPELLDVLRDAGVVDAGGAGLVEIARGIVAAVTGEELAPSRRGARARPGGDPPRALGVSVLHGFPRRRVGLDAVSLERELEALGDSLLVVGDESALKIHVHTDDPGAALSLGTARGAISGVEIADMHVQTAEREDRLTAACRLDRRPVRRRGRRRRQRQPAPLRESRRRSDRRGRPVDEPVDRGHPRGDRGERGLGGRRAAEQRQRHHERRAGRRPRGEAGGDRAHAVDSGGLVGAARVRPGRGGGRERGRRCARRSTPWPRLR